MINMNLYTFAYNKNVTLLKNENNSLLTTKVVTCLKTYSRCGYNNNKKRLLLFFFYFCY